MKKVAVFQRPGPLKLYYFINILLKKRLEPLFADLERRAAIRTERGLENRNKRAREEGLTEDKEDLALIDDEEMDTEAPGNAALDGENDGEGLN